MREPNDDARRREDKHVGGAPRTMAGTSSSRLARVFDTVDELKNGRYLFTGPLYCVHVSGTCVAAIK